MFYRPRYGMQLLELTISLTTASMLLAGLTASIVVASRASELASSRQNRSLRNTAALDRLRSDLAEASPVLARSATSATLSIGDRNADEIPETIHYRWLGAGTPLEMSSNGGAWQSLSTELENFQFGWQTCQPQSILPTPPTLEPTPSLIFQSQLTKKSMSRSLSIDVPSTFRTNDLLVLAASVRGDQGGEIIAPAGWVKVDERIDGDKRVSLAVWYSFSSTGSSLNISWPNQAGCCATLAHFRVNGGTPKLEESKFDDGSSQRPNAPSRTAAVNNSLVIRVMGASWPAFTMLAVDAEATNMAGHLPIALQGGSLFQPIIGMTYRYYPNGSTGSAEFNLPASGRYVTATLVFSP